MEKLVELLNEYERERVNHSMIDFIPYGDKSFNDLSVAQVISKKYGFIKWLVENEKIDTDIVYKQGFLSKTYDKDELGEYFELYEEVLMLLSIQDEPMDFLVSILKE